MPDVSTVIRLIPIAIENPCETRKPLKNKIDDPLRFFPECTYHKYKNTDSRYHNPTDIFIHHDPPSPHIPLQYMTCTFFILHEYLSLSCLYLEKEEIFG